MEVNAKSADTLARGMGTDVFNSAGLQRYFTVDYETPLSPRKRGGRVVILDTANDEIGEVIAE